MRLIFFYVVHDLAQDGTFGGNDVIVAFSRCFNYSVIIHQPNAPRWEVHPEVGVVTDQPSLHIAYLHGEHYCSVKPLEGDVPPHLSSTTITSTKPKVMNLYIYTYMCVYLFTYTCIYTCRCTCTCICTCISQNQ